MIYLFNGCKDICALPQKICQHCAEVCRDLPCANCFDDCAKKLQELINRPMGGFVFMSVWVGVLELACCGYAIYNKDLLADCVFPVPRFSLTVHRWLSVQLGFAALNVVFSPYLQNQVWRKLNEEAREPDNPEGPVSLRTRQAQSETGPVRASKHDITQAFKEVFLYDIGVCLYAFVLVASFVCSYYGNQQIALEPEDCDDKANGFPRYSSWIGMFFVVFVVMYGFSWAISIWCMDNPDTLTLRRGLNAAATVAAAAGKPIPGFPAASNKPLYHSPQEAAQRTDRPAGLGGFFSSVAAPAATAPAAAPSKPGFFHSGAQPQQALQQPTQQYYNNQATNEQQRSKPSCGKSFVKLLASLGLDMLGNATYFAPGVGEFGDTVFAPASAVMLKMMYNANGVAMLGLVEELLPGTDIFPTATVAWFLQTMAPNSPVTRALGINDQWEMTGGPQK